MRSTRRTRSLGAALAVAASALAGAVAGAAPAGGADGNDATGPVADSARELAPFVDAVLGATGAKKSTSSGTARAA